MSSLHVLVIGAGLGGLALATGLNRNGIRCTVFERDATPRDRLQGYRIVVRNEPMSNVTGLDALYDLISNDAQKKLFSMAGNGGNKATGLDENLCPQHTFTLSGDSISIGRMALRDVLIESLGKNVIEFGKKFISYERRGDKIVAKFEDGQEVEGDLLVAADGGNSRVRRQFFPNHDPRIITGVSGIVAKIPVQPDSEAERIIQRTALRDGMVTVKKPGRVFYAARHILHSDAERLDEDFLWSNHRSYIYWVLNTSLNDVRSIAREQSPHKLPGDQLLSHALDLVNDFHPDIHTLIRSSDPATAIWLDFNSGEVVEWDSDAQITFLGDSIHGMTPYLGAGALLAIVDGWKLSKTLVETVNGKMTLIEAIKQYETEMKARSFPLMQKALQAMLRLTDPNVKSN